MPPKKKGKKSKKKKEQYLPPLYNIPAYEDPEQVTPKVDLIIKLANPVNDLLTLKIRVLLQYDSQVPITTKLEKIHQEIAKMHQGAIMNIKVCRDRYNPEEVLDSKKTLEQCGIFDGEVKFFYDYSPVVGPLLK
ncbi:hypothetical protein pb186bvf_019518 [Paramecium bursaria]